MSLLVVLSLLHDTYLYMKIITITTTMMSITSAPVVNPPMNKPLAAAGESGEPADWRELLQLLQSTATTVTDIPSTIKENGDWLASLLMMTEAVSEPSLFEYSMVDL